MSVVRVCAVSDIQCSRGCGAGACKKELAVSNETLKDGESAAQVAVVVKDLIETLMLWNGQASAGLDVKFLAGLRDELVAIETRAAPQPLNTDDAIDACFRRNLGLRVRNLTVSADGDVTWIVVVCKGKESSLEVRRPSERMSEADSPFADAAERAMFLQTMDEFEDCNETMTDDFLLMKWANAGLLECNNYLLTEKGQTVRDAARKAEIEHSGSAGGEA
jgi:hypothetical protein